MIATKHWMPASIWMPLTILACCMAANAQSPALVPGGVQPLPVGLPLPPQTLPNSKLVAATVDDAGLNAIRAANEDRLCAVGDRGAILLTENGGHTWQALPSPTTCNLYDLAFEGEEFGIAVGGLIGTRAGTSFGVALRTLDGGKTWSPLPHQSLARLTGVSIVGNRILAWGDYNPVLQSSMIESRDGGETWQGIPADIGHVAAAGVDSQGNLAAIDRIGRWFDPSKRFAAEVLDSTAQVQRLFYHHQHWWLCGDHGLCRRSSNGLQWNELALPLSELARDSFHLQAVSKLGNRMWLAGNPGSIILTTADGGDSWRKIETGETLPIRDMLFIDANRGWLVGSQGAIWATRDGGETWFPQRRRALRVVVLSVSPSVESIPWSPLIATAWDKPLPVASIAIAGPEPLNRSVCLPDESQRVSVLAPQVGIGSHTTWMEPPQSKREATARLAVALRTWRPDVLLTDEHHGGNGSPSPLSPDWMQAIQLAAVDEEFPIAGELELPAWKVSKWSAVTAVEAAEYSESNSRLLTKAGLTVWDLLLHLPNEYFAPEGSIGMRTVWATSQAPVIRSGLIDGVPLGPDVARAGQEQSLGNYQLIMGRVHRRRSLEQIVEQPQLTTSPAKWAEDFEYFVKSLPDPEVGWLLAEQTHRAVASGYFDRQQVILQTLVQRRPNTDVATWAAWEILRLKSSDEFQTWRSAVHTTLRSQVPAEQPEQISGISGLANAVIASPFEQPVVEDATRSPSIGGRTAVIPASADADRTIDPLEVDAQVVDAVLQTATPPADQLRPFATAGDGTVEWFAQLDTFAQLQPAMLSWPECIMLRGKKMAHLGNAAGQREQLEALLRKSWMVGWQQAARQELLIGANRIQEMKWVAFADFASEPPLLDGRLGEACWRRVPRMRLERLTAAAQDAIHEPTTVAWAYDENYLYIGIDSPRVPGAAVASAAKRREYDADLTGLDHCGLVLDTDRDYCSAIELFVAENGLTGDRCCGYTTYNPRWHVSVQSSAERWTTEIAIPLDALTQNKQLTGKAWGVSARRSNPGGETESWSQLKTHNGGLEANGILLFVPPAP